MNGQEELTLKGPVLVVDGELVLLIPLDSGGSEFIGCTRGIAEVQGAFLKIAIPSWLAGLLRIEGGDLVVITKQDGKFGISAVQARPVN